MHIINIYTYTYTSQTLFYIVTEDETVAKRECKIGDEGELWIGKMKEYSVCFEIRRDAYLLDIYIYICI